AAWPAGVGGMNRPGEPGASGNPGGFRMRGFEVRVGAFTGRGAWQGAVWLLPESLARRDGASLGGGGRPCWAGLEEAAGLPGAVQGFHAVVVTLSEVQRQVAGRLHVVHD